MMKQSVKILRRLLVSAGCLLLMAACSSHISVLESIHSTFRVNGSPSIQEQPGHHARGKAYFRDARYGLALEQFNQELARNSRSIPAMNGIAACYDQLKRFDLALVYYYKALQRQPDSFETLGNLGYSFVLQGRFDEASRVLKLALSYHPKDARVRQQLALLEGDQGIALAGGSVVLYPVFQASKGVVVNKPAQHSTNSLARVYPVRRVEPRALPATRLTPSKAAVVSVVVRSDRPVSSGYGKIEVSNGNGSPGNARLLAQFLKSHGERVWRITNARGFGNRHSVIYYRPGSKAEAERIAALLPASMTLLETTAIHADIFVRMVVGQDLVRYESMFKKTINRGRAVAMLVVLDGEQQVNEMFWREEPDMLAVSVSKIMRLINANHKGLVYLTAPAVATDDA